MNGPRITTSVADSLYPAAGHNNSPLFSDAQRAEREYLDPGESGALAAAREAVARGLSSSGFTNLVGAFEQNFATFVGYGPAEVQVLADLQPGVPGDLTFRVKSEVETDRKQALNAQARVPPEAAVRLLT